VISKKLERQVHWKSPTSPNVFHVRSRKADALVTSVTFKLDYGTKSRECDSAEFG
jgi:hypothetical protein